MVLGHCWPFSCISLSTPLESWLIHSMQLSAGACRPIFVAVAQNTRWSHTCTWVAVERRHAWWRDVVRSPDLLLPSLHTASNQTLLVWERVIQWGNVNYACKSIMETLPTPLALSRGDTHRPSPVTYVLEGEGACPLHQLITHLCHKLCIYTWDCQVRFRCVYSFIPSPMQSCSLIQSTWRTNSI